MKRGLSRRGELVLSMTLAEIFLLLLIVGWYGMRLESETGAAGPPTPEAILREELREARNAAKKAEEERQALEMRLKEHERILEWLQDHYGGGPVADLETLRKVIATYEQGVRDAARRGKPVCSTPNVLVRVVVDDGQVSLTLLEDFASDSQRFPKGLLLSAEDDMNALLNSIGVFYGERLKTRTDCAYDYELAWRTDRDYRAGRQWFEKYFYPARVIQLQ